MSAAVESEVVRAGEAAVTVAAFERFDACVFTVMSRQLVRACKLPCTVIPCALVWLFTRVCASVGFQMRAFCVHLIAAFKLTPVDAPSLRVW